MVSVGRYMVGIEVVVGTCESFFLIVFVFLGE